MRHLSEKSMMRLIAIATFALAVTIPAQAMPVGLVDQPHVILTEIAYGCGVGRSRVAGVCVARTTKRHVRREVRREIRRN